MAVFEIQTRLPSRDLPKDQPRHAFASSGWEPFPSLELFGRRTASDLFRCAGEKQVPVAGNRSSSELLS